MSIESWRWVLGKKTGEESYTHSSGTQLTSLNHENNKRTNKTNEQTNNSSSSINQRFTNITLAFFFSYSTQILNKLPTCTRKWGTRSHREYKHTPSPPYRHTPKSIHPDPRPQMDRRLGEIIPFFCFFLESTNKIQTIRNKMKRKRDFTYEVPLLMTKERGGRESRDRYDGDVTDGIVGNGVREGERER